MDQASRAFRFLAIMAIAVVVCGAAGLYLGQAVTFREDAVAALTARLQQLIIVAVVIERAVEVYLGLSDQNGQDRHDEGAVATENSDAKRPATLVALLLSSLVAICGVRVLDSFATLPVVIAPDIPHVLWTGVDVLLTAGLIAGGSYLLHEVAETITGGIRYIDPMKNKPQDKTDNTVVLDLKKTD